MKTKISFKKTSVNKEAMEESKSLTIEMKFKG